jgi:N-acylneuraminate cytidylyltransferase
MRLAVIPARGGSKRIPGKNIRLFAGKPVLSYSIKAALESNCFDEVIVSTDDEGIAAIAREHGAATPFMRPAALADDHTILADVMAHAIDWYQNQGRSVSQACCIFATAPFVSAADLKAGQIALTSRGVQFALSVTSFAFAVQRALRLGSDGSVDAMYPQYSLTRSQDLDEGWHDAGQFCWGTARAFLQKLPVFAPHTVAVKLPRHRVQDLDTLEDWHRAELMYEVLRQTGEIA